MILFRTEDKLTALTKWPVLPFISNFSENECNKFNCSDFKLSNDVNTCSSNIKEVTAAGKSVRILMHTPKKGLVAMMVAGGGWRSHRGGGVRSGGGCSPGAVKKFENAPKNAHFSIFVPLTGVQILLEASV